ncbi:MAG: helix-turn-helix transcriptional regulator [Bacteroidia bacterium]|nr:helix-turn-helix transcriptional regulator [Bacteroidia bacterium]
MKKYTSNFYYRKIILKNIKKLRINSGISEEYMSIKLKITQGMYSKFEAGYIKNINEYWSEIANILTVPPLVLALPDCFSIVYENEFADVKVRNKKINESYVLEKYFKLLEEKETSRIKHIKKLKLKIKELNEELKNMKNIVLAAETNSDDTNISENKKNDDNKEK